MAELSEEESQAHMARWGVYMNNLADSGNLVGGMPLDMAGRVLRKDGATEGVVKSKDDEAIGGWLHFKANDYDHAIDLAKGCPIFELEGNVEIREVIPM